MRLTYRNKLFLGVITLVWIIFGALFYFQYTNEVRLKKQMLRNELKMIDKRVMSVYEDGHDLPEFLQLLSRCYQNSTFDAMQISVYGPGDSLIACVKQPIPFNLDALEDLQPEDKTTRLVKYKTDTTSKINLFYFASNKSSDGKITVKTGMPYDLSINKAISTDIHWLFFILITLAATIVVFLSTRLLSHNIFLLRQFAIKASQRQPIDYTPKFPHDELGEIAQEILNIYNSLLKAIDTINQEHQKAIDAIEEKDAFKRRITNNINHEIKTPLSIIRGYTETIINNPDMDTETRDNFMKRILENVDRLNSLLSDISTIAKLEECPEDITISNVNMLDIVQKVNNDLNHSGLAHNMSFSHNITADCRVRGNSELITSVLLNLVRNSIIHSNGTEMAFGITDEDSDFYTFTYYDNGNGVNPEQLNHLFERFYRADSGRTRKKGGVGLGLSIVKRAIITLKGSIIVKNRDEGGLEFIFTLPKAPK